VLVTFFCHGSLRFIISGLAAYLHVESKPALVGSWKMVTMDAYVKIDKIQEPDNLYILGVLQQAKENVAPFNNIVSFVNNLGFLDGKVLYEIDQ
jgi:hypothetical protein